MLDDKNTGALTAVLSDRDIGDRHQYMIAIDGGGTKTEFALLDMQGRLCKHIVLDGSNPNISGLAEACAVLKSGIDVLCAQGEQLFGIYAGISGCGAEKNKTAIAVFLGKHYPQAEIRCDTDVLNVLGCVPEAENCVLAICGTGSVVYAHEDHKLNRLGGWGYLLDADGSGFGIGKDALCATLAWEEGIGPKTEVAVLVAQRLEGPVWNRIDDIYSKGQEYVASFAPLVFQAFCKGDSTAAAILQRHFKRMAFLIEKAMERYACNHTVVIAGGLLKQQKIVTAILKDHLFADTKLIVPQFPQIFGACIQCCRLCGVDTALLERTFEEDYKNLEVKSHA